MSTNSDVDYISGFEPVIGYGYTQASTEELSGSLSRVEVLRRSHDRTGPLRACEVGPK